MQSWFMVAALFAMALVGSANAATGATLKVDHASVCGSSLPALQQAFSSIGLAPTYGGPHGNGVTQMALLGFEDGSYLELIAPQKAGVVEGSPWAKLMAGDAGACAWAIGSEDIQKDVDRLKKLSLGAKGPEPGSRKKPDGTVIEWQTASLGPGSPGATLPFMIEDKTPRSLRVQPSASVKHSGLTGVEVVVLAVNDLQAAVGRFRRAFALAAPTVEEHKEFGAKLAYFPGTPVMLAEPLDNTSWLAERLVKFGESPVAYLLGTEHLAAATKRYSLSSETKWFGRNLAWFDAGKLEGLRLGVIQ